MPTFKITLGLLFALLAVSIGTLAFFQIKAYRETTNTTRWVEHSRVVLEHADEIASAFKVMQLESNAAFIQRDTAARTDYSVAKSAVQVALGKLDSLTADNPPQQERVTQLRGLLDELTILTDSAFVQTGAYSLALINRRIATNFWHRDRIQSAIDGVKFEEHNLLSKRQASNQSSIDEQRRLSLILLTLVSVIIAATFFAIRNNFNKRIKIQDELTKANELFFKLFYESPVAMVISQPADGVIIDCNRVYAKLINYDRKEIIGKTAKSLNIMDESFRRDEFVRTAYSADGAEVELLIHPKGKKPVWTRTSPHPIQLKERESLLSAVIDISAHKEAEASIKKALKKEVELNKLKSNFVSLASHEFRTPLTTILSSSFLLENYLPAETREKTSKHIGRIKTSVNALTGILDEFLSLTKIEEGKTQAELEDLDVKALISAICASQEMFVKTGQHIRYAHSGTTTIHSDAAILTGIVSNLISNAIKYSPENTEISVVTAVSDELFELTVKDAGMGIPVEDQAHLFERFYRASNAKNVQGTGLGLHITKHYVALLNGSIHLKSEPGHGSEFTVTFKQK